MEIPGNAIGIWVKGPTDELVRCASDGIGTVRPDICGLLSFGNPLGEPSVDMHEIEEHTNGFIEVHVSGLDSVRPDTEKLHVLDLLADTVGKCLSRTQVRIYDDSGWCPSVERDVNGSILLQDTFCLSKPCPSNERPLAVAA